MSDETLRVVFPQYLYNTKTFDSVGMPDEQSLNEILNEMGPQGWELVSVTQTALQINYDFKGLLREQKYQTTMYFKLLWPSNLPPIPTQTTLGIDSDE